MSTQDSTELGMTSLHPEQGMKRHLERVKGIEPSYAAWEAAVLPLNYTRIASRPCTGRSATILRGL